MDMGWSLMNSRHLDVAMQTRFWRLLLKVLKRDGSQMGTFHGLAAKKHAAFKFVWMPFYSRNPDS